MLFFNQRGKKLVMLMLLENSDIMENESEDEGHLKEKWDHFVTIFDDRRFEDCWLDFKLMTLLIKMCTSAECCMLVSSVLKGRRLRMSEFIIDIVNRLTLRRRGDWWSRWQEISSRKQRNSSRNSAQDIQSLMAENLTFYCSPAHLTNHHSSSWGSTNLLLPARNAKNAS